MRTSFIDISHSGRESDVFTYNLSFLFLIQSVMRGSIIFAAILNLLDSANSLETNAERRIHRHHRSQVKKAPIQSLSELLVQSADLTKQFERQATALRSRVQESEAIDSASDDNVDTAASFIETDVRPLPENAGLQAMEAVTEEVMRYTDRMRKLGNEASLFSRR